LANDVLLAPCDSPFRDRKRAKSSLSSMPGQLTTGDHQLDVLSRELDIVFCGLNPTTTSATSGCNFPNSSNHFWSLLHLSGFTDVKLDPRDERRLLKYGCGITTVVGRPTRRPFEIQAEEFKLAWPAFEAKMRRYAPKTVAFLGKRSALIATGQREVAWGRLPAIFPETTAWVLPNPRGPNRSFPLDALVKIYAEFRTTVLCRGGQAARFRQ
jgi:TDG/mug DNA glycosylase family protein